MKNLTSYFHCQKVKAWIQRYASQKKLMQASFSTSLLLYIFWGLSFPFEELRQKKGEPWKLDGGIFYFCNTHFQGSLHFLSPLPYLCNPGVSAGHVWKHGNIHSIWLIKFPLLLTPPSRWSFSKREAGNGSKNWAKFNSIQQKVQTELNSSSIF